MENVLDIVIVFTALVAGFLGWRLGVMRVVVPLVGSGAGVFIATHYHDYVARYVPEGVGRPEVVEAVSFAVIALVVFAASVVVASMVRGFLRFCFLGWADSLAGLAAGAGLALVLWSVGMGAFGDVLGEEFAGAIDESRIANYLVEEVPQFVGVSYDPIRSYVEDRVVDMGISRFMPVNHTQ